MIAAPPAAMTYMFGAMLGRPRLGWVLFAAMTVLFVVGLAVAHYAEAADNQAFARLGVVGGNMEGKEIRFGVGGSVLTGVVTSNGATGSNAAMHGSFTPMGVMVLICNMLLGEIVYGGLGTGLYSMVMTALLGLAFTGPMIGRTPEYAGKRLGPAEMKTVVAFALVTPLLVLPLTAIAAITAAGRAGLTTNEGPRAFTELAFAYTSCVANNGQALAGLNANSVFYNLTTIVAMLGGRFLPAIAALALAGLLGRQARHPASNATLPTDGVMFLSVIVATALIVGGLSFLPTLAFGPIVEQLRGPR
jgi:K+-transporting ATPase ATPase A chain